MVNRSIAASLLLLAATLSPGCGGRSAALGLGALGGSGSDITIASTTQNTRLDARFRTAAYSYIDQNTADLFFTDLTMEQVQAILDGQPRDQVAPEGAQLLHIHMFLLPRAGRTPIDFAASNITITHAVIAGQGVGIYGGGGFLLPGRVISMKPGEDRFGGIIRGATLRFVKGSPNFVDRIDSAVLDGSLNAKLHPNRAQTLATLLDRLARIAER